MSYGGAPPTITPSYSGFVNGEGPGPITYVNGTLTVTKAPTAISLAPPVSVLGSLLSLKITFTCTATTNARGGQLQRHHFGPSRVRPRPAVPGHLPRERQLPGEWGVRQPDTVLNADGSDIF